MGMNTIIITDGGMYYGEMIDNGIIKPNQLRSYWIESWFNTYDHNRNTCMEVDDQLKITFQSKSDKLNFTKRNLEVGEMEVWNHAEIIISQHWDPHNFKIWGVHTEWNLKQSRNIHTAKISRNEYLDMESDYEILN